MARAASLCLLAVLAMFAFAFACADARQINNSRNLKGLLDSSACDLIQSDPQLSSMADMMRPYCDLIKSPQVAPILAQAASSMGFDAADVQVVIGCICG